jgi:hypothetical protein
MTMSGVNPDIPGDRTQQRFDTSQSIDWYSEGETRTVEVDGVRVIVRFVGRQGRRGRIAISAPAGAKFQNEGIRR